MRLTFFGFFQLLFFFFGLGDNLRDDSGVSVFIQRNINEVGSVGVGAFAGERILGLHPNFRFDGCTPGVSDFRVQDHEIADLDRVAENHRVDGNGDHAVAGVAHASQSSCFVHEFHDPAAVNISKIVGVFRLHELCDADAGSAYCFCR